MNVSGIHAMRHGYIGVLTRPNQHLSGDDDESNYQAL